MNFADAIAKAHDQNERALAGQVAPYQMDVEAQQSIGQFVRWCADHGVRSCPATPATVAAFVRFTGSEISAALLSAIAECHDAANLANPVATAAVRSELNRVLRLTPPRSWKAHEKLLWADLPPDIRATVARREQQRETEVRRMMSKVDELKKRHGGAKPAIEEKEITK